jgi:hypothetical protein
MVKLQPTQRAAEPAKKSGSGSGMKKFFVLVLLAAAGYAGWMYWTHYRNPPVAEKGGAPAKANSATAAAEKPKLTTNNNVLARAKATLSKVSQFNKEGEGAADSIQGGATKPSTAASGGETVKAAAGANTTPWSAVPGMPRLQAIFYKPVDPTALVAGKIVKAGDEIGGAKVVEVKERSVRMQLGSDVHDVTIK